MSISLARRAALGVMGCLSVAVAAVPAEAQFSVDKTRVLLTGRAQSALVRVTNDSPTPMRFDVKIFAWDHKDTGEEVLTTVPESVVAPGSFALEPKQSQNIRVGSTATVGALERPYRLIIEELPRPRSAGTGASVAMRMRLSIPVFLEPAKGDAKLDLGVPSMAGGLPSVVARNTGTVHLQIDAVKFRGVGAKGEPVFTVEQGGAYVLPGKLLRVDGSAPVAAETCKKATRIFADVTVHGDVVTHDAPMAAGACGK